MGGGGSPKSRHKEQSLLIYDSEKGGGVKKWQNFAGVIYGRPLTVIEGEEADEFHLFLFSHAIYRHMCFAVAHRVTRQCRSEVL